MQVKVFATACAAFFVVCSFAFSQDRDFYAERIILDDNSGNTITLQTPAGPITGGTLTLPDPAGAGTLLTSSGSQSISGDVLPGADDTYDLGSGASRWQDIFASGNTSVGGEVRFVETGGGTDYVGFVAPAAVAANQVWTLPAADGTNGQVLSTNGSGILSWITAGGGGGTVSTNASLTGDGSGGSPLGIALNNANTYTATQTFSQVDISNGGELRLIEPGGANFSAFQAQAQAADVTYTLPAADGTNGQVLTTNGSGTLSWAAAGGGGATVSTANLNFPATAGQASTTVTTTVTGAADGDVVLVTAPAAVFTTLGAAGTGTTNFGQFDAWVSAANTVTVRFYNDNAAFGGPPPLDPDGVGGATYTIVLIQ